MAYRSFSATESRLGGFEVCSMASCLSKSVFLKKRCALHFLMVELNIIYVHAQRLLALRMFCNIFFFLGSTLNSGPHACTTLLNREFSSIPSIDLLLFFLPTFHSQSSVTVVSWASSCWWKKSDSATSCVFAVVYPHSESTFEEGSSTDRIVQFKLPYTLRGSTLSEFFHHACGPFEVFVDRLYFLWVHWNRRNDTRAWSEMTPEGWLQSKLEHVYLLCDSRWSPTACQSPTFLQDRSTLSMLRKTYTPTLCSPVM